MAAPMVITPLKVTDIKKQCLPCSSTQKRLFRLDNPKSVQNGYIQSIENALNVELPSWHFFVCSSCAQMRGGNCYEGDVLLRHQRK